LEQKNKFLSNLLGEYRNIHSKNAASVPALSAVSKRVLEDAGYNVHITQS
jgi:hypothetical protein